MNHSKKSLLLLVGVLTPGVFYTSVEMSLILMVVVIMLTFMLYNSHISISLIFLEILSISLAIVFMLKSNWSSYPLFIILMAFCVMAAEAVIGLSIMAAVSRFYLKEQLKLDF